MENSFIPTNQTYNTDQIVNNNFIKKSFSEKLSNAGALLGMTFKLGWLGGAELKKPLVKACIFAVLKTTLFFGGVVLPIVLKLPLYPLVSFLSFVIWLLLSFYGKFLYTRMKADQALLTYYSVTGKVVNYETAHTENGLEKSKIRSIAFIDMLIKGASSMQSGEQKTGVLTVLFKIFFSILTEVWDLLSNFLLPAIVIEKKPFKEVVPNLKSLKDNIPQTLVGVFGIDFVGLAIESLFSIIYFFGFILAVAVGYGLSFVLSAGTFVLGQSASGADYGVNIYPIVAIFFLIAITSSVYARVIDSVKAIYYSCFYTLLTRRAEIVPQYAAEIENYLNFNKQ